MKRKTLIPLLVFSVGMLAVPAQAFFGIFDSEHSAEEIYIQKAYIDRAFLTREKFDKIVKAGLHYADKRNFDAAKYNQWAEETYQRLEIKMPGGIYLNDIHGLMPIVLGVPESEEEGYYGKIFYAAANLALKSNIRVMPLLEVKARRDYRVARISSGISLSKAKSIMGIGAECHKDSQDDLPVRVCNWRINLEGFFKPHAPTYSVIHYVKADMNGRVLEAGSYNYM